MKKGDIISGYTILQDFTTAGGGLSKWTFARKDGEDFFFKEFLSPTYPVEGSPGSPKTKAEKLAKCKDFESRQHSLISAVSTRCVAKGGNLVFARDFFRSNTKYYKVTEKIDIASLDLLEVSNLSLERRILIMKTVAHSVRILHQLNIVHGDLKPNNILIKKATGGDYVAKLIDFDNSFFSKAPPSQSEELVGDLAFYSPEFAAYAAKSGKVGGNDLQTSSDIFALGLVYSLYLTARFPGFDEKYQYCWHAANSGYRLQIRTTGLPNDLIELINSMLQADYRARPTISQVFDALRGLSLSPSTKPSPSATEDFTTSPSPSLRGTLARKREDKEKDKTVKHEATTSFTMEPKTSEPDSKPPTSKLRGKLLK